jgi:hypothetical protein
MLANLYNRIRGRFVVGAIAALVVALPCAFFAQSPLTIQPSTGNVGIGNTNPSEALDVTGTVKATTFKGDGSQLSNFGASRVELALDYFRKVEASAPAMASAPRSQVGTAAGTPPGVAAPRVIPQLPRRERLPLPPTS